MPRKTLDGGRPPATAVGFNEAAARCRGKRDAGGAEPRDQAAGFNEAAARCRGKPSGGIIHRRPERSLQ